MESPSSFFPVPQWPDQDHKPSLSASRVNSPSLLSPQCVLFLLFCLRPAFCPCSLAGPLSPSRPHLAMQPPACLPVSECCSFPDSRSLNFGHVAVYWLPCCLDLFLHMPRVYLLSCPSICCTHGQASPSIAWLCSN